MKKLILLLFYFFIINSLEAHPGIGIVMDNEGNVYYTDLTHVWKISKEGKLTIAVENVHTHELYLDSNGNLYGEHEWYNGEATDTWGNYVWCLNKEGNFEKVIPDFEGFLDNTTLIRDNEGNSYWSKKSGNGEVLMKQSVNGDNYKFSSHQFDDIRWMHFSTNDENLYVVDNLKIKKITPSGNVEVLAENLKENGAPFMGVGDRHYIFGLWTDTHKNIYVALYGAGKVKKINHKGEITTVFVSDEGWSPSGGLIEKDGTLWIMEFSTKNKTRVRKVMPNAEDMIYGN
ncbi:hypothetical protein [Winogradskyella ouciana]|uniref:hypothetical protein n=1 Tax=Winogradskyella ouciana TaxID=2608631 RepID=UPI003D26D014